MPLTFEEQLEGLFSIAVGAIGINPFSFYDMTIAEVKLAEKGYMEHMELQANLMLMAHRQSQAKKPKLFDFATKPQKNNSGTGVNQSTIEERNKTLEALKAL